ncbi:hypothetical protein [Arenibaculum pallidiluteum]|uniref:hypothetical protein n=1 Tax=Arenibaculum pallidiluteum TaxID=2812559 RepID=UPI001A966E85|nr:hypothetical protein [Arenibaculum pallidiluteum]
MKTIAYALALSAVLATGAALAGEGSPNPLFPGSAAEMPRHPGHAASGNAEMGHAAARPFGTGALSAAPEPGSGPTRLDPRTATDAPAAAQHRPDFDQSVGGPYSRM